MAGKNMSGDRGDRQSRKKKMLLLDVNQKFVFSQLRVILICKFAGRRFGGQNRQERIKYNYVI